MRSMFSIAALAALMEATAEGASGGATSATSEATKRTKPESETVEMADGRKVEFVGKRRLLKESFINGIGTPDGSIGQPCVRLDFRNGETRTFVIPGELLAQSACHGIEQKLGDETAGEDDLDDMVLSVDALIERLSKRAPDGTFQGEWTTKREGGMSGTSVLMKALMEFSSKTKEEVMAFLKDKTPAEKTALRGSARLKPIIERLEQEKLAKSAKVDTDALLGSLGAAA